MKVNINPPSTQGIERTKTNERVSEKEIGSRVKGDAISRSPDVEISEEAKILQRATQAVRDLPPTNTERIAELKKSIQSGTYKVDVEGLAEKIINEHLQSDFGKNNL